MASVIDSATLKPNGETAKDIPDEKDGNNYTGVLTEIPLVPRSRNSIGSLNAVAEHAEESGDEVVKETVNKKSDNNVASKPIGVELKSINSSGISGISGTSGISLSARAPTTIPTRRIPHLHKLEKYVYSFFLLFLFRTLSILRGHSSFFHPHHNVQ